MSRFPQDLEAFQDFLDIHGTRPEAWPQGDEASLTRYLAQNPAARATLDRARRLDALINDALPTAPAFDSAVILREAARTAQVIPLRPRTRSIRPIAALAASLLLGFVLGANGLMPLDTNGARDVNEFAALVGDAFSGDEAP